MDVKDIYNFFKEENPSDPMTAFLAHFSSLPKTTNIYESKFQQVKNSIALVKMARQAKLSSKRLSEQAKKLGVKI